MYKRQTRQTTLSLSDDNANRPVISNRLPPPPPLQQILSSLPQLALSLAILIFITSSYGYSLEQRFATQPRLSSKSSFAEYRLSPFLSGCIVACGSTSPVYHSLAYALCSCICKRHMHPTRTGKKTQVRVELSNSHLLQDPFPL